VTGFSGWRSCFSTWRGEVSGLGWTDAIPGGMLGTGLSGCATTGGGFSVSTGGVGRIGAAADESLWFGCWPTFSSMTSFDPSALVLVALALGGTCCCCVFNFDG
jgi:hypothetical protein